MLTAFPKGNDELDLLAFHNQLAFHQKEDFLFLKYNKNLVRSFDC